MMDTRPMSWYGDQHDHDRVAFGFGPFTYRWILINDFGSFRTIRLHHALCFTTQILGRRTTPLPISSFVVSYADHSCDQLGVVESMRWAAEGLERLNVAIFLYKVPLPPPFQVGPRTPHNRTPLDKIDTVAPASLESLMPLLNSYRSCSSERSFLTLFITLITLLIANVILANYTLGKDSTGTAHLALDKLLHKWLGGGQIAVQLDLQAGLELCQLSRRLTDSHFSPASVPLPFSRPHVAKSGHECRGTPGFGHFLPTPRSPLSGFAAPPPQRDTGKDD
ncbi:hypothetical protein H4582DRAFT_2131107 [Lactarius indigo]|nr:hypothetical protein H4582DRAFT_2131107 [Lactarius indigo]